MGLGDVVHFAGTCSHDRLGDWYRAADLTVLPSRSEGLPNVLRESIACGTPFVASAVGGIAEIAPSTEWLVPAEDAEALARRIDRALRERWTVPADARPPTWDRAAAHLFGNAGRCRPMRGRRRGTGPRHTCWS
jgi:glycosyltransferase involved in cell wall biosynthesis